MDGGDRERYRSCVMTIDRTVQMDTGVSGGCDRWDVVCVARAVGSGKKVEFGLQFNNSELGWKRKEIGTFVMCCTPMCAV